MSIGSATVLQAQYWKTTWDLSFEVLADPPPHPVFASFVPDFAPWDAILSTSYVVIDTGNSVAGDTLHLAEIMAVLNSLFDPQPQASPNPLVFGNVEVGSFVDCTLVLKNVMTGVFLLQNVYSSSAYFVPTFPPPPDSIFAVGDSAVITVRFQPTGITAYNETLTFVTSEGNIAMPMQGNGVTGVEWQPGMVSDFSLETFPNPFNPELNVKITLPRAQDVAVDVYTVNGTHVATVHQGRLAPGSNPLTWSAQGSPSGIYLLKVKGNDWQEVRKVVLLR